MCQSDPSTDHCMDSRPVEIGKLMVEDRGKKGGKKVKFTDLAKY